MCDTDGGALLHPGVSLHSVPLTLDTMGSHSDEVPSIGTLNDCPEQLVKHQASDETSA